MKALLYPTRTLCYVAFLRLYSLPSDTMQPKPSKILFCLSWCLFPILYPLGYALTRLWVGRLYPIDQAPKPSSNYLIGYRSQSTKPLPTIRPRRLTLPLPSQNQSVLAIVQRTGSQAQPTLFTKFPAEIRLLVYELILSGSGGVMHMVRPAPDCLSHVRCTKRNGRCEDYECFKYWTPDQEDPKKRGTFHRTSGDGLPLLLTCRKM